MAGKPTRFPWGSHQTGSLVLEVGQSGRIQLCCEIIKPGTSWHFYAFFTCCSTTFKIVFSPVIPCCSLKEENLWGFEINFSVGSLKFLFLYGISALLSGTWPSQLGWSTKMTLPKAVLRQMVLHTQRRCLVMWCYIGAIALPLTPLGVSTSLGWFCGWRWSRDRDPSCSIGAGCPCLFWME